MNAYRSDPNTPQRDEKDDLCTHIRTRMFDDIRPAYQTIHKLRAKKRWSKKESLGKSEKEDKKKGNKMEEEKERKIQGSSEQIETECWKGWRARAKRMRRCMRRRGGERVADSTRTERAAEGWLCTAVKRETSKEEQRREKSGGRTDTNGNGDERRDERRAREETERVQNRANVDERARENEDEKERRYARKERRNDIERKRERKARVKAGGRERRRASACPAEGARRPHMF